MKLYMVEIRVRDWPATYQWYRDILGIPVEFEDEPNQFAMLSSGGVRLAIKAGRPEDKARDSLNLVFVVKDVDVERSVLVARGATPEEPFDSPFNEGYREMRLRVPEGTQIRLFSWQMR